MTNVVDAFSFDERGVMPGGTESSPAPRPSALRRTITALLASATALLGLAAGASSDGGVGDSQVGLLASLPVAYWVAVGMAIAISATVLWGRSGDGRPVLIVLVPLWIGLAHVAPLLSVPDSLPAGSMASMAQAWTMPDDGLIAGKVSDPSAFHGLVSTIAAELPDGLWHRGVRLWPAFMTAVSALMVSALASRSYPRTSAVGPMSALVYVLIAWFEVGYLGSGAVGFAMLLAMLVLTESGPLQSDKGSASNLAARSRQVESLGDRPESYSVPVFVALLLLSFGATVSDPAVPAAVCGVLLVLALYGRTVAPRLWIFSVLAYTVWSVLTERPWWDAGLTGIADQPGHLVDVLIGGSSIVPVGQRIAAWGGSAIIVFLLAFGILMVRPRFAQLRPTVPLVPLAVVSALAATVVSPTERWAEQAIAISAAFSAVLIGRLLSLSNRAATTVVFPLLIGVLLPAFLLIRFGSAPDTKLTPTAIDAATVSPTADSEGGG